MPLPDILPLLKQQGGGISTNAIPAAFSAPAVPARLNARDSKSWRYFRQSAAAVSAAKHPPDWAQKQHGMRIWSTLPAHLTCIARAARRRHVIGCVDEFYSLLFTSAWRMRARDDKISLEPVIKRRQRGDALFHAHVKRYSHAIMKTILW